MGAVNLGRCPLARRDLRDDRSVEKGRRAQTLDLFRARADAGRILGFLPPAELVNVLLARGLGSHGDATSNKDSNAVDFRTERPLIGHDVAVMGGASAS